MSRIRTELACPKCKKSLEEPLHCPACHRSYPLQQGIPVLLHPDTEDYEAGLDLESAKVSLWGRLLPEKCLARFLNDGFLRCLDLESTGALVLNLGAGNGSLLPGTRQDLCWVHMDLIPHSALDVVADAHYLPFADTTFDAVYSNSVLEHVMRPWLVAQEILRVLKPGGRVYINVPFLLPIHHRYDFWRFTDRGLEVLFSDFEKLRLEISGGPTCALAQFFQEYLALWIPRSRLPGKVAARIGNYLLWASLPLDRFLVGHPHARDTATSYFYVGRKPC